MDLRRQHILITGGAGFIGSHLADQLIREGAKVRILDNMSTGAEGNINPACEFVKGDIRDDSTVANALHGIDFVYHLAAQINPAAAVEDPLFDFDVNVKGTMVLLMASMSADVKKMVMASTNVYGNADVPLMSEDFPTLATRGSLLSPYAAAKVAAEAYLKVANDELGLPTVRTRFTNVYGPRQLTKSESGVIAIFAKASLRREPMRIYGDGSQTRDFVYVEDVVSALMAAGSSDEANGGVFNVGVGVETSVNELAEQINEIAETAVAIEHIDRRAADFKRVSADLTLSRRVLGYDPQIDLASGLTRYYEWCQENLDY